MTSHCSLDRLPVELVHTIFRYFFAHELLLSFTDVSDYIDAVLLAYSSYRVTVHRMSNDQLDRIDLHIRPDQIVSLILSDDFPITQSFFSRFRIEQFTRLRSLKLQHIEYSTIPLVFTHLDRLQCLRSLSFDTTLVKQHYPAWNDDYRHESARFNRFLQSSFNRILPRLTHLRLNSLRISASLVLPYLQHLVLTHCSVHELSNILQQASQLQSIDVGVCSNTWNANMNFPSNQLKDLRLNVTGNPVSMEQIEQLLKQFPYLQKFTLECFGRADLLDGHRWQSITRQLISLAFKLTILDSTQMNDRIASFSTEYWLKEKHWLIVSYGQEIFSIPHFLPTQLDLSDQNVPTCPLINDRVTKLVLHSSTVSHVCRFESVKHLELHCPLPWKTCQSILHPNRLVSLSVDSFQHLLLFLRFQSHLPQLREISIDQPITVDAMVPHDDCSWRGIRQLKLCTIEGKNQYILQGLFSLFPSIESIVYVSRELSAKMMFRLINGFENLSAASFHTDATFAIKESESCRNPDLFIDRVGRFTADTVICRVYHTINSRLSLHIDWHIQKQTSTPSRWRRAMHQVTYQCCKYRYRIQSIRWRSGRDSWIISFLSVILFAITLVLLLFNISIDVQFLYDFISNAIVCYLIDRLRHQFKTRNHIIVHLCLCVIVFILSQMIRALFLRIPSSSK